MVDADALLGVDGSPRTLDPGCTTDSLHINDAGHAILAKALVDALAPLIAP